MRTSKHVSSLFCSSATDKYTKCIYRATSHCSSGNYVLEELFQRQGTRLGCSVCLYSANRGRTSLSLTSNTKMTAEIPHIVTTLSVLLLVSLIGYSFCAPAVDEEIVYDQRQNGTENFRVHINGIVIVHAPLEALTALSSVSDEGGLQQLTEIFAGISANSTNFVQHSTEAETSTESESSTASVPEGSTSSTLSVGNVTTGKAEGAAQDDSQKPHKKTK